MYSELKKILFKFFLRVWFRQKDEFPVMLGTIKQRGSLIAFLKTKNIWKNENLKKKIKSIVIFKWHPSENIVDNLSKKVFIDNIFGYPSDYNEALYRINYWHNSNLWDFSFLTEVDRKKSEGLDAFAILLKTKHNHKTSSHLHLSLFDKAPEICFLLHPMVVKTPVISIQYCIEIHSEFTFNEIRASKIEMGDDIISYIYELQFIQLKTAISLHEFLCIIENNEKNKGDSLLTQTEFAAINEVETIIKNLKATIEKTIILLGLMFKLKNLDGKKNHKDKIFAIEKVIPEKVKNCHYYELIKETIKPEGIEKLNNLRTGLLHKKGVSKIQPHSFVGQKVEDLHLREMFLFFIDQHSKNSLLIISTYAILTDILVELKRPNIEFEDLPM